MANFKIPFRLIVGLPDCGCFNWLRVQITVQHTQYVSLIGGPQLRGLREALFSCFKIFVLHYKWGTLSSTIESKID